MEQSCKNCIYFSTDDKLYGICGGMSETDDIGLEMDASQNCDYYETQQNLVS